MIQADAPAKIILFGEHAVVYGRPAIAVPLSGLRAQARVEEIQAGEPGQVQLVSRQTLTQIWLHEAAQDDPLASITRNTLARLERAPSAPIRVTIDSAIPPAAGLGSGAAVSVAIARALGRYFGIELEPGPLSDLAYEVEIIHHGSPSGVDNTVVAHEKPVFFIRGKAHEVFQIRTPFTLVLAHSGEVTPTTTAVGKVRNLWEAEPEATEACFDAIGGLTHAAYEALRQGQVDVLGGLMTRNHELLKSLGVSSERLDQLAATAREAGAVGAKLSGAGLGGYLIALVNPEIATAVRQALRSAGADGLHTVEVA
jgi:mevalonate kinase